MTVQELNTLRTVCELERKKLLQYLQCQYKILNLLDSFYQEVAVTSYTLKNCLALRLSTFFLSNKAGLCFDCILIHFKDTLMYVDPITRQTYD